MRTRWSAYAGVSAALAGGVIVKALAQRPNFYSAAVYLAQSSANLMILSNFLLVAACTALLGLQKVLYGPLRPIEIEQLYEKAWFAVTETCLAMTIFRGEIGAWFLVMFFALLAGKVWAWIGEGRVEILEQQPPRNPRLFHTRLALSLGLSVLFDLSMLEYVVKQVMHMARPDMMVMFGFEFAVLSIVSLSTASRYAINLAEIAIVRKQKARRIEEIKRERIESAVREVGQTTEQGTAQELSAGITDALSTNATVPLQVLEAARRALQQPIDESEIEVEGWEGKGRWIFYLDLATDFFKLVVYLSFFFILLIFYGLPIHILRDVFMTFRSFFKRIGDFLRYRTATRDMNARYPDATAEEIGSEDVCIICREEMRAYQPPADGERPNPVAERMRPKKLPCGHILHFACLRSWLERQQICPTCRTNVVSRNANRSGNNNAAAPGAGGQHGNAAPAERQGARIYQWGPLRIGIGAARGNMLEDLQQQLVDGQQRPAQHAQGEGPQQYGFGIRWDGLRRRDRGERSQRSVQRQLDDVQRQISHEYRALGQMTNELRLLRNMEAELTRLRAQRQGGTSAAATANPAQTLPTPQPGVTNPPSLMALTGAAQQILPAGSNQLPAGLTLPEGWTLMPLHQTQPGTLPMIGPPVPMFEMPLPPPGFPGAPPVPSFQGEAPNSWAPFQLQQHFQNNQPPTGTSVAPVNAAHPLRPIPPQQGPTERPRSEPARANTSHEGAAGALNGTPQLQNGQNNTGPAPALNTASQIPTLSTEQRSGRSDFQSTPHSTRPPVNGTATQNAGTNPQTSTVGTNDPPVASMFTLPSWGSVPMEPSTSNRAVNERTESSNRQGQSSTTMTSDSRSASQAQADGASPSENKRRNPTVEDLVEAPD